MLRAEWPLSKWIGAGTAGVAVAAGLPGEGIAVLAIAASSRIAEVVILTWRSYSRTFGAGGRFATGAERVKDEGPGASRRRPSMSAGAIFEARTLVMQPSWPRVCPRAPEPADKCRRFRRREKRAR